MDDPGTSNATTAVLRPVTVLCSLSSEHHSNEEELRENFEEFDFPEFLHVSGKPHFLIFGKVFGVEGSSR